MLCEQKLYGRSNKSIPPLKFMNFDPMIRSSIPLRVKRNCSCSCPPPQKILNQEHKGKG